MLSRISLKFLASEGRIELSRFFIEEIVFSPKPGSKNSGFLELGFDSIFTSKTGAFYFFSNREEGLRLGRPETLASR